MSCNLEAELTAYVDDELGPAQASAVRAHLSGCADCRSTEALLRKTLHTLSALPEFEPSPGLRRTVLGAVESNPAPSSFGLSAWLRPAVLLPSGLLLASILGFLLTSRGGQTSLPTELQDGAALDVAMNYDVVANYEVLGLDSPEDVEVVAHLQELEGRP
jgi:anti-sigma factor RsiW